MAVQQNEKKSKAYWLSLVTTIAFFIVNLTGFVDTMTGSTEGCGKNWPLCNGSFLPTFSDIHAIIEYGHRLIVFTSSVLLVVNAIVAWRKYGFKRKVKVLISLAFAGIVIESFLGALSVFFVNPPLLMASHMGVALTTFGSLVALTATIYQIDDPSKLPQVKANKFFARFTWFSFIYLFLAIYFGAYVAATGSGGYFRGFPIPTETFAQAHTALWIDITHRTIALGLLVITIVLTVLANRYKHGRRDLYVGSVLSLILVCLQAISGGIMIYANLNLASILLHVAIVSLLFGDLAFMSIQCMLSPGEQTVKGESGTKSDKIRKRSKVGYA